MCMKPTGRHHWLQYQARTLHCTAIMILHQKHWGYNISPPGPSQYFIYLPSSVLWYMTTVYEVCVSGADTSLKLSKQTAH